MLFLSWQFLVFFILVFILYYLLPRKYQWVLALLSSYFFYFSWNPAMAVVIIGTTLLHYFLATILDQVGDPRKRKIIVGAGIFISLLILGFFKYLTFINNLIVGLLSVFSISFRTVNTDLITPIGLSFYTFMAISYLMDVYRQKYPHERNLGYFSLYFSFFPHIISGPIDRANELIPQFKAFHPFDENQIVNGLRRIALGMFKKLVIADTLVKGINVVFGDVNAYSGLILLIISILYSFQIYCDFSGYTDIAIGCSKVLGIDLMENFKTPYFASSVREFWTRWHISLSSWFKEYLYIPLGGSRKGKFRTYINIIITFLISGLWHGANLTYVVWGGLHGVFVVAENLLFKNRNKPRKLDSNLKWLGILLTFSATTLARVIYRANSLSDAIYVLTHQFVGITNPIEYFQTAFNYFSINIYGGFILLFELLVLFSIELMQYKTNLDLKLNSLPRLVRWSVYFIFLTIIVVLSSKGTTAEFIYARF